MRTSRLPIDLSSALSARCQQHYTLSQSVRTAVEIKDMLLLSGDQRIGMYLGLKWTSCNATRPLAHVQSHPLTMRISIHDCA